MSEQPDNPQKKSEIVLYRTEDGRNRIQVRMENETVWLTQALMAELFQTSIPNISIHIRNILLEGELGKASVVKEYLITAAASVQRSSCGHTGWPAPVHDKSTNLT
ncbi:MAG TPA: hypothetical protein VNA25_11720 [Phycisphaerae bacterium]|nr:hypothetical protein [Phycisphaerae bacterium]